METSDSLVTPHAVRSRSRQLSRVLFVDDDPAVRQVFARSVSRFGFLADLAQDGEEALDLAEQSTYPVIVTDLAMPGMDGISLIRRLRARQPHSLFIIVTGRANVELPEDAVLSTAVASVLKKPWTLDELGDSLRRAARLYEARHSSLPAMPDVVNDTGPILLLEDNDADADLVTFYLSPQQREHLIRADRLVEAIDVMSEQSFGVILCDLTLPDARGLDAVLRIQNAAPQVPLIILSGLEDEELSTQAVQAGAQDYLAKDELNGPNLARAIRYAIERKRAELKVAEQAHYDGLTGLPNRLLFQQRLAHALSRSRRTTSEFALLFIDLDHFKAVNDTLGHAAGDAVLVEAARRLESVMREYDTVARLGGDEFAAILDELPSDHEVARVADRILAALRKPFTFEGQNASIGCSIGIAVHPHAADTAEGLLRAADEAMYEAKKSGRNTYAVCARDRKRSATSALDFNVALKQALERGEFLLHYQPQVDVKSGRIVGVEALLRWNRNGKRLVPPSEFIPTLEQSGDILWVGTWAIHTACEDLRRLRDRGHTLARVSVNLSASQLNDPHLLSTVRAAMTSSRLSDGDLELEVTESMVMGDTTHASKVLSDLRALGARIAMDDFGTGYSSLAYLHRLPFNVLKIDRSFVSGIGREREADAITMTILALGHGLNLETVAEGVETEDQRAFLERSGCGILQGFLLGRPMPVEELELVLGKGAEEASRQVG